MSTVSACPCNTVPLDELLERIEAHIRRHDLIEPGGEALCLVSGGADSTCLFHALGELGYRVSALHVDHGLRGTESNEDARWCAERFGAEVVEAAARCANEAELRDGPRRSAVRVSSSGGRTPRTAARCVG